MLTTLIQGVTEAFPISSSLHINILMHLMGVSMDSMDSIVNFAQILNISSAIAFTMYNNGFILAMIKDIRILIKLSIMTLPPLVIGFIIKTFNLNLPNIFWLNILAAGVLIVASFLNNKKTPNKKTSDDIKYQQALVIGFVTSLAFFSGTSRLGITYSILKIYGLDNFSALTIALVAGIPITFAAGISGLSFLAYCTSFQLIQYAFFYSACIIVSSILTFRFLRITFALKNHFYLFGIYRIILAFLMRRTF